MNIDAVEVFYIKNPMIAPFVTACGDEPDIYSVLVNMHSGAHSGWSEASPMVAPTYSPEFAYGVYSLVTRIFAPIISGKDIDSAEELLEFLSPFRGNPFAKSVLESAWWMLKANIIQKPLHILLGGKSDEVEVGADLGVEKDISVLLSKIDTAIKSGYKRIKLKVRRGWDINVVHEVRQCFPIHTFHVDCNSGYTMEDMHIFREFDKYGLEMIEQPLFHTDLHEHAKLQSMLNTPICLDESCNSVRAAKEAIELGSCRYMNIKYGRVGGLKNAKEIHDICRQAGIKCWVGGMLETSVGAGICLELATLDNFSYPADIFPSNRFYATEISDKKLELFAPGRMKPSEVPGTSFIPDMKKLKKRQIEYICIEK